MVFLLQYFFFPSFLWYIYAIYTKLLFTGAGGWLWALILRWSYWYVLEKEKRGKGAIY